MTRYPRPLAVALFAVLLGVMIPPARAQKGTDAQIQADAQKQLGGKKFAGVHVQVQDGVVSLTGQVDRYIDKEDAQKRIEKMHEAASVRNDIRVASAGISDAELFQKLSKQLVYDRQGYATYPFNSLTLQVNNGIATVGGVVVQPTDKDSALGLLKNAPGVQGVVDNIKVAPVSPSDDRIRAAEYQAIYGYPQFEKYAISPAKPIRIVVVNGHVILTGVVDSAGDRDLAGIRANQVPGVFSVQNDLQVPGQTER